MGERSELGARLTRNLVSLVLDHKPRLVACYLSTPTEPDTRRFLSWALTAGIEVIVPTSRSDGTMDWIRTTSGPEAPGLFGIPELLGEPVSAEIVGAVDLVMVPAAAIDRTGMRLGWGKGYYDRALEGLRRRPLTYGVIFDQEYVEELPAEPHDKRVDGAITPSRTIEFLQSVPGYD